MVNLEEWNRLLEAAMLGLERSGNPVETLSPDFRAYLPPASASGGNDPADSFLSALTLAYTWRKAGESLSAPGGSVLAPAPVEPRPFCNAIAVDLWRKIRQMEHPWPYLEERWLRRCLKAGYVLAPEILTDALTLAEDKKNAHLRPLVAQVAGVRGLWLAEFYPPWRYVVPEAQRRTFLEGKPAERLAAFHWIRTLDPEEGRSLLSRSWPRESNTERPKLLEVLANTIVDADEAFLNQVWDQACAEYAPDSAAGRQIKQSIAQALLRLPGSELYLSWETHLRMYFSEKKPFLVLPDQEDACLNATWMELRHGFSAPGGSNPIFAWWRALLGFLPPSLWQLASGQSAESLPAILADGPYQGQISANAVSEQLVQASLRFRDGAFAERLLEHAAPSVSQALMALLPPSRRESYWMHDPAWSGDVQWSSPALHFEWSEAFSEWVLRQLYESWGGYYFHKVPLILPLDQLLHPNTRPEYIPDPREVSVRRERWMEAIVPELNQVLTVKRGMPI